MLLSGERPYGTTTTTPAQLEQDVLQAEPPRLSGVAPQDRRSLLRGDLDNIVAKALRKSPAERYASVQALADDLRRHLRHEPVLARPDSFSYLARKYLRRNRVGVATGTAIALAVIAGIAATLWQAQEARKQAVRADQEAQHAQAQAEQARASAARTKKVKDFMVLAFEQENPLSRGKGGPLTMAQAIEGTLARIQSELGDDAELQADLLDDFGEILAARGEFKRAEETIGQALQVALRAHGPRHPAVAESSLNLAALATYRGSVDDAAPHIERAVTILRAQPDVDPEQMAAALSTLAWVRGEQGNLDAYVAVSDETLALRRKAPGPNQSGLGAALNNAAWARLQLYRYDAAYALFTEATEVIERNSGPDSVSLHPVLLGLVHVANARGQPERVIGLLERSLRVARAAYSGDHAWTARSLSILGAARCDAGQEAEGEAMLREGIAMQERVGDEQVTVNTRKLVACLRKRGQMSQALAVADRGIAACSAKPADPVLECLALRARRGAILAQAGDHPRASADLEATLRITGTPGPNAQTRAVILEARSQMLEGKGRREEAMTAQRDVVALLESVYGQPHPEVQGARKRLAALSRP